MVLLNSRGRHCEERAARRSNLRHAGGLRRLRCKPRWPKGKTAFWQNEPEISNSFNGTLMPRDNARNLIGIVRLRVAAPDHMQVRPDQKIVEAVDTARRLAVEIERRKRRADCGERLLQARRIAAPGKPQQRVAVL